MFFILRDVRIILSWESHKYNTIYMNIYEEILLVRYLMALRVSFLIVPIYPHSLLKKSQLCNKFLKLFLLNQVDFFKINFFS